MHVRLGYVGDVVAEIEAPAFEGIAFEENFETVAHEPFAQCIEDLKGGQIGIGKLPGAQGGPASCGHARQASVFPAAGSDLRACGGACVLGGRLRRDREGELTWMRRGGEEGREDDEGKPAHHRPMS